MVAQLTCNQRVASSNLAPGSNAQLPRAHKIDSAILFEIAAILFKISAILFEIAAILIEIRSRKNKKNDIKRSI